MVKLKSVADVITVLGGMSNVAKITNCRYGSVWHWKYVNKFPGHSFLLINEALKKRGFDAPSPALWGMKRNNAA
jgi:hypothetical protein